MRDDKALWDGKNINDLLGMIRQGIITSNRLALMQIYTPPEDILREHPEITAIDDSDRCLISTRNLRTAHLIELKMAKKVRALLPNIIGVPGPETQPFNIATFPMRHGLLLKQNKLCLWRWQYGHVLAIFSPEHQWIPEPQERTEWFVINDKGVYCEGKTFSPISAITCAIKKIPDKFKIPV